MPIGQLAFVFPQDGKSYAEKHLCIILKAIGRDCLRDVTDTDAKVNRRVKAVVNCEIRSLQVLGSMTPFITPHILFLLDKILLVL